MISVLKLAFVGLLKRALGFGKAVKEEIGSTQDCRTRRQRRDGSRYISGMSQSLFQIGLSPGWKGLLVNRGDLVARPREDRSEATTRGFGRPFPDFP